MFHWIKVFWHIWPDLMQLFKHVKAELPSTEHKEALSNAIKQAKVTVTVNQREVEEFNEMAATHSNADKNIDNLNSLEDE